ncbi:hypothetical protein F4678DRAFT_430980 [Xylaria arbuscula]|nr:hypothetical protein F4678DRAFT_430980 [Xylaria arbuscula]
MPPKKKAGALPRGGGLKTTNTSNNKRRSQPPPTSGTRWSKRIQDKRRLGEAPELLAQTQASPESRVNGCDKERGAGVLQPNQNQYDERPQIYSKLATWLDDVRAGAAEDLAAFDLALSESNDNDMAARSEYSLATIGTSENPSTIPPRKPRAKKPTLESFRTRRVEVEDPREDKWTPKFRTYLIEKRLEIPFKKTETLQKSFKKFERKAEEAGDDGDSWDAIEELCKEINEWKATMRLATITEQDFKDDLLHCKYPSNEAVFQRTVMMSIIDRSHLNTVFDFNCEGQWSLDETHPLPSTNGRGDLITGPKPDLAIFFRFSSLVGTDPFEVSRPIPPELKSCMNPDGYTKRCFPFIFIEAKNGFADIQAAALSNMHSASQALFNIYTWMNRANDDEIFFKDVRLFSIAINAKEVIVRVHRARAIEKVNNVGLAFSYDELYHEEKVRYTRDEVCTLLHNILIEYAEKKLLGILKNTVDKVLKAHEQGLKRKNDTDLIGRPSKMVASAQPGSSAIDPLIMNPSTSLGMSQIEIHDG